MLTDGSTSNALVSELGDGRIVKKMLCIFSTVLFILSQEMLLDLFVHPEGPRLRDRVSHGEVCN